MTPDHSEVWLFTWIIHMYEWNQLEIKCHNFMATADRAVMVFVKEFQWDQRPQQLQNGLIHYSTKINSVFKTKKSQ